MNTSGFVSKIVAIVLVAAPVALPTPSHAFTVTLNVGTTLYGGRQITCLEGERRLRSRGFYNVRSIDCRGAVFVYRASRDGRRFEIAVSRRDGRVVDVQRIRR
jgi:hypothetical protein